MTFVYEFIKSYLGILFLPLHTKEVETYAQ